MTILIAGTFRVADGRLEALRPHMQAMLAGSRAEAGCITYSYAEDLLTPGLFRVFEAWRDEAAVEAHLASAHMVHWRATSPQFGLFERQLIAYEVSSERPF